MNSSLTDVLNLLDPITLEEMDNVKLMDRTDTKFVFNLTLLPSFIEEISSDYKVLEVSDKRTSRYETLYFDTSNFELYNKHHNGKLNRYKVRFRKYVESDLHFFEVKFKNNKGRTIKDRVKRPEIEFNIQGKAQKLLAEKTPLNPDSLVPNIWVNYTRTTLVNKFSKERLTIDTNLQFKFNETEFSLPNLVIAEVKQEKCAPSPFLKVMRSNHLREGSISKYCLGVASIYDNVKKNNFKHKIQTINKIAL